MRHFLVKCKECNESFSAKSGASKHCDKCRFLLRSCKNCGKGGCCNKKFCSHACRRQWMKVYPSNTQFKPGHKTTYLKKCLECGAVFESNSGSAKWCQKCCVCEFCGKQLPNGSHRFCGNSCSGKWKFKNNQKVRNALRSGVLSPNRGAGISRANTGKPRPYMRGENNPNWNGGGLRQKRRLEMGRVEYLLWRSSVFKRDEYKCVICCSQKRITAHHIKPWSTCNELRFDQANGITICWPCHLLINGRESEFEERFYSYTKSKSKVVLSNEEIMKHAGVSFNCAHCNKPGRRPWHHRNKKRMFCNILCVREWEKIRKISSVSFSCS